MTMSQDFLIDSIDYSKVPMKLFRDSIWIINPWEMRDQLVLYINDYLEKLESDKDLLNNFNTAFKKLIYNPLKAYKADKAYIDL